MVASPTELIRFRACASLQVARPKSISIEKQISTEKWNDRSAQVAERSVTVPEDLGLNPWLVEVRRQSSVKEFLYLGLTWQDQS